MTSKRTIKRMRVYVDLGSHQRPFMFVGGNIADNYPTLLHVHHKKVSKTLTPAILEYKLKVKK